MNRNCKCGGRMFFVWENVYKFCYQCNRCRRRVHQRKRLKRSHAAVSN